jgi:DNA invertase Pin-like site-specific DNA recombinase
MLNQGSEQTQLNPTEKGADWWIGYCRVSTDRQAESGLGLEAQQAILRAAAEARGINIRFVIESGSAKNLRNRPLLGEALLQLQGGEAAGLIVAKLDRLSRSLSDFLEMRSWSVKGGWELVALDLPDSEGPMGRAMGAIMATFGELERELISTRTSEAAMAAKARGSRLGPPRSERSTDLALRAEALRNDGLTFQQVADTFNTEAIATLRGGAMWRPSNVQALLRLLRLDRESEAARSES